MQNPLFAHLTRQPEEERELTEEEKLEQEAEAKAERVRFHREKVRNGPQKFTTWTSGQGRRAMDRAAKSRARKATKAHRREWMHKQADLATLRGHLTILGVIECKSATTFSPRQKQESAVWVVRKFGQRDESGALIADETNFDWAIAQARQAFLNVTRGPAKGDREELQS